MDKTAVIAGFLGTFLSGMCAFAIAGPQQERRTVWTGVYTETQAQRGSDEYLKNCSACHGVDLEGVANLKGPDFMERWREFDVRNLYDFVSQSMPRERKGNPNKPGSLSEAVYVSILAHIFRSNDFPPGKDELTTSVMKNIQIEGRDGPKPVPNGALIQTVGCMTPRGSGWVLMYASEPVRVSKPASSTEEVQEAQAKPFGRMQYTLSNLGILGAEFTPTAYEGHKMYAKGFISRQNANIRINVTSMESIGSCR